MYPFDTKRKPGRPRIIPETTVPKVIALYKRGLGYRAISRELKQENLSVSWSTVRRLIRNKLWVYNARAYIRSTDVTPSHSVTKDKHWPKSFYIPKESALFKCLDKQRELAQATCRYQKGTKNKYPALTKFFDEQRDIPFY